MATVVVKTEESCDVDDVFEEDVLIKEEISIKSEDFEDEADLWCLNCGTYENSICNKCAIVNQIGYDLPDNLRLGPSKPEKGVFAMEMFLRNHVFGPFLGLETKVCKESGKTDWKMENNILTCKENSFCYMKYIKNVDDAKLQNLFVYQEANEIYFKTIRTIFKGEELFVKYDKKIPILIKNEEGSKVYVCEFCDLHLNSENEVEKHQKRCMWRFFKQEKEKCQDFQCPHCKTVIMDQEYFNVHISRCSHRKIRPRKLPKNVSYYKCDHCNYKTWRKPDLERHLSQKHKVNSNQPIFKCSQCDYSTPRKNTLNRHLNTHSKMRLFKCIYCEKRIATIRNMYNHVLNNHRQENNEKQLVPIKCKIYECHECQYVTVQVSHYKEHLRVCKKNAIHLKCEYCEYSATNKKTLGLHLKSHMTFNRDNKKFLCNNCHYETKEKKTLEHHLLTHHPKFDHSKLIMEKLHCCQMCDYKTAKQVNLNIHVKCAHKS